MAKGSLLIDWLAKQNAKVRTHDIITIIIFSLRVNYCTFVWKICALLVVLATKNKKQYGLTLKIKEQSCHVMSCRCRCRCRCRYMRSHSLTCKAKCQSTHARHHNYYLFFILQNNYLFFAFCVTFLATKRKIFFSVWSKTKEQSCHAMSMYDTCNAKCQSCARTTS